MQADWTRLQEHNAYLRRLYAQQFRSSRKVVDELGNCRRQIHTLRCEISDLRQLVQSAPTDLLREAHAHIAKLVSLNKIQVEQKLQQQLVERRGIVLCAWMLEISCLTGTHCYRLLVAKLKKMHLRNLILLLMYIFHKKFLLLGSLTDLRYCISPTNFEL